MFSLFSSNQAEKHDSQLAAVKTAEKLLKVLCWNLFKSCCSISVKTLTSDVLFHRTSFWVTIGNEIKHV